MGLATWVGLVGLGAGAMYFLDPEAGEKRRAAMRARVRRRGAELREALVAAVGDARRLGKDLAQGVREGKPAHAPEAAGRGAEGHASSPSLRFLAGAGGLGRSTAGFLSGGVWRVIGGTLGLALAERLLLHPHEPSHGRGRSAEERPPGNA